MLFFVILGLLCFDMGAILLDSCIKIFKKGKCAIGRICEIEEDYTSGKASFCIEVQFNKDGQEIKRIAMHRIVSIPFFVKHKLSKLRKKQIGKQVHIYYNPNNDLQVLLWKYIWKRFLISAFLMFGGIIVILTGVFHWY